MISTFLRNGCNGFDDPQTQLYHASGGFKPLYDTTLVMAECEFVLCQNRSGQVGDSGHDFHHLTEVWHHPPWQFMHENLVGLSLPIILPTCDAAQCRLLQGAVDEESVIRHYRVNERLQHIH